MRKLIAVLFINLIVIQYSWSQTKEICITLDDLPTVPYSFKNIEYQQDIINKLITTFDTYQIPAIGFVNERKLYTDDELDMRKVDLLKTWLAAGYELGNHTYSHPSYHKVSLEDYTNDILEGEKVCKELANEYNQEYKYFRHPFLHIGLSSEDHDNLKTFLTQHDYEEAPVSIDNNDYIFAFAYSRAMKKSDEELMKKIADDYLDYMEDKLIYYEELSDRLLGRNIKHILLLHANAINSDYLDDLMVRYQKHGYRFISIGEALKDPAYQNEITVFNNWGISWVDRWALSAGEKGDFFEGDPTVPEYVQAFLNNR